MLTLHESPTCPFCGRVRILVAEKELEVAYISVDTDTDERPDALWTLNPMGSVPVLEDSDAGGGRPLVLAESLVILEYLDELGSGPSLLGQDIATRGRARLAMHRFYRVTEPYYMIRKGDPENGHRLLAQRLAELDKALRLQPYIAGEQYTLADITFAPHILRCRGFLGVNFGPLPALNEWLDRVGGRAAVAPEVELSVIPGVCAIPAPEGKAII